MNVLVVLSGLLLALCYGTTSAASVAPAVDYASVNLSDFLDLCDRKSPEINQCFKHQIQQAVTRYHNGLPELGIPQFDPMIYSSLKFNFDNPIMLLSSLIMKNFKVLGLGKTKVNSVNVKFPANGMMAEIDVSMPKIFVEGLYKGQGRYTNLQYSPKGYFNVTITDIRAIMTVAGRTEKRNGVEFLKMEKFDLVPQVGQMKTYVDGLFPDPALTQLAVELINNNWRAMLDVSIDEAKRMYEPLLLEYANAFFAYVPFTKMFL